MLTSRWIKPALLAGTFAAGVGFGMPAANADTINDVIGNVGLNAVSFQDDNLEWEIDGDGNPGILGVGDRLQGVAIFPEETTSGTDLRPDLGNSALGAIFDVTVVNKTAVGGGLFNFAFKPTPNGLDGLDDGDDSNDSIAENASIAFYEDTSDFTNRAELIATGNRTDAINLITDGDLAWVIGEQGLAFEGWNALNANDNLGVVQTIDDDTSVGDFNFTLSILQSNLANVPLTSTSGQSFGQVGNGQVKGGDVGADDDADEFWDATSNASVGFTTVSVPSTLALLGFAFMALGAIARRNVLR